MRISDWSSDVCSSDLLVVREIHRRSARGKHPIFALNCAAIPAGLVESEFFGHTRGAFTGAISDMPGKIRLADKSTLFLDEIGELDDQSQAKLLRVIETKEVFAAGGNRGLRCDVDRKSVGWGKRV